MMPSSFIHAVTDGRISFLILRLKSNPLHMYTTFLNPFIHQHIQVDTLTIVNNASIKLKVQISFQDNSLISFQYILRRRITESCGSPSFNFLRNLHTVFHNGLLVHFSTNSVQGFPFFRPLLAFATSFLVDNNHLKMYEVIAYRYFDLHLPDDY